MDFEIKALDNSVGFALDGNVVARLTQHGLSSNGFNFIQDVDPALDPANGVKAYDAWAHVAAGVKKVRNVANDGWVVTGTIYPYLGPRMAMFTTSGTFTGPPGVTLVYVTQCGGGGGGAAYSNASNGGAGGGGGGWTYKHAITITEGQVIPITIGGAGAGSETSGAGNTGGAGGTTSFGSALVSTGGAGGVGSGAGGVGGQGLNSRPGGRGSPYDVFGTATSASGGGTPFSTPTNPERGGVMAATGYGTGGQGAPANTGAGGVGTQGFCLVEW